MLFRSTHNHTDHVSLLMALARSKPASGGLYVPERIPVLPPAVVENFAGMTMADIAYVVGNAFFGDELDAATLRRIAATSFDFNVPLVRLDNNMYALELFHGPTLSFKDLSARYMIRLMAALGKKSRPGQKLNMVVATNGNAGAAIADAVSGIDGIELYVLFPRSYGSRHNEKMFTTQGGNVHALEVQGSIDDCQAIVQQALADAELTGRTHITSVNSDNIGRLIPQTFYYFYALSRMRAEHPGARISVAVPCGNLGNLCAAVISKQMGLHIDRIYACENANARLTTFMKSGRAAVGKSKVTLAHAADRSAPTCMPRLLNLYDNSLAAMYKDITPVVTDDAAIISSINDCYARTGYTIDPSTALAYHGMMQNRRDGEVGLILSVAHPAKSLTAMNAITGRAMELPLQIMQFMGEHDKRQRIAPVYSALRNVILSNNQ